MATVKTFTSIKQSRKLAEILPIESADGFYEAQFNHYTKKWEDLLFVGREWANIDVVIPSWSLAALLDVLSLYEIYSRKGEIQLDVKGTTLKAEKGETLLDLAVNMIITLHEQNLL